MVKCMPIIRCSLFAENTNEFILWMQKATVLLRNKKQTFNFSFEYYTLFYRKTNTSSCGENNPYTCMQRNKSIWLKQHVNREKRNKNINIIYFQFIYTILLLFKITRKENFKPYITMKLSSKAQVKGRLTGDRVWILLSWILPTWVWNWNVDY